MLRIIIVIFKRDVLKFSTFKTSFLPFSFNLGKTGNAGLRATSSAKPTRLTIASETNLFPLFPLSLVICYSSSLSLYLLTISSYAFNSKIYALKEFYASS